MTGAVVMRSGERRPLSEFTAESTFSVGIAFVMPGLAVHVVGLDGQRRFQASSFVGPEAPASSADGALSAEFTPEQVTVELQLDALAPTVTRLVVVVSHETHPIATAQHLCWSLKGATFTPLAELKGEKTVVLAELYRHTQGWRVAAVGQGYAGGWSAWLASIGAAADELRPTPVPAELTVPPLAPGEAAWELQSDQGEQLLHLREVQPLDLRDARPLSLSSTQRKDLGNALQGAIKLAVTAAPALMNVNAYRLVLSPQMQHAMREGASLMRVQDGVVGYVRHAKTGQIMGAGHFKPDQLARFANVATIGFQIAAMVTAQYYLHSINKELKSMDQKLDGLQEFLETQATGRLVARMKAVERGMRLLQQRSLDPEERAATQGDVLGLIREAEGQMAQHELPLANLEKALEKGDKFSLEQAKQVLDRHSKHMNTALFAAWTNIQALQLALHLGWAPDRLQLHQDDLSLSLKKLERATNVFEQGLVNFDLQARARGVAVPKEGFSVRSAVAGLLSQLTAGKRKKADEKRETLKNADQGWVPTITVHRRTLAGLREGVAALEQHKVEVERRQQQPLVLVAQLDAQGQLMQTYVDEAVAVPA
jgi:hypothetical protein